jgi:molybdate transport system substrate-binding protein
MEAREVRVGTPERLVIRVLSAALLAFAGATAATAATPAGRDEPLMVFAAASLTDAFAEAADSLAREGIAVRFSFAGSQQLALQLEQGARADVFASADARAMQKVRDAGRVDGEPRAFAYNRLAAIVPAANPARITRLEQLGRPGVKLVIGADAVPVGHYAREVLTKLAREPGYGADFARRALANVVSEEENVRGVVAKVALGEADAGIVYRSDVTAAVAKRVRVIEIPASANVTASYPVAVLRDAAHPKPAAAFVAYLRSAAGQRLLARHGFVPLGTP